MLDHFHQLFFSLEDAPQRTRKHMPHPSEKSTCKRLNMFLRWMVRDDGKGVDFGLWKNIRPDQLVCPLDVHVERVARKLGLITRKQTDWQAAVELTANLRRIDPDDPVGLISPCLVLGCRKEWHDFFRYDGYAIFRILDAVCTVTSLPICRDRTRRATTHEHR